MVRGRDCVILIQPKSVADDYVFADRRAELRGCLQAMLATVFKLKHGQLQIDHDAKGRPRPAGVLATLHGIRELSITYGARGGAVALSRQHAIGVDMQRFSPRNLTSFRQAFRDCDIAPDIPAAEAARIWTRMEAAGKLCGLGLETGFWALLQHARSKAPVGYRFADWQISQTGEVMSLVYPGRLRPHVICLDRFGNLTDGLRFLGPVGPRQVGFPHHA